MSHVAVLDAGNPAAVLLCATIWGDIWLVADDDVLTEHPDIEASGLPVIRFDEVPRLSKLDGSGLRALGLVKRAFPTARVLQ